MTQRYNLDDEKPIVELAHTSNCPSTLPNGFVLEDPTR
jgi:hypothetical protein